MSLFVSPQVLLEINDAQTKNNQLGGNRTIGILLAKRLKNGILISGSIEFRFARDALTEELSTEFLTKEEQSQILQKRYEKEIASNEDTIKLLQGTDVCFGHEIILMHTYSKCYLK